ncbi:MAG: 2-oxoglutarate dehydrogenase E1 component, partial [Burkholderiales bacterium]
MSRQDANAAFALTSFLDGGNATYIEDLYGRYLINPGAVDAEWQAFFKDLKDERADTRKPSWQRADWPPRPHGELVAALDGDWGEVETALGNKIKATAQEKGVELSSADVQQATRDSIRALMLIRAYRARGHFHANLDPLGLEPPKDEAELDPRTYSFTEADMDRPIFLDKVLGLEFATVREMLAILRRTYCQTLGVEFMHISDPVQKGWMQERIEGPDKEITFTREGKRAILNKLIEAEGFEKFCDTKFTGTKRFGLDGAESMIPALEQIIKRGGALGVKEIVLGMAHRGRLNVLAQVMGKPHRVIFHEFKGGSATTDEVEGSGDVKYHLGASSDREFDGNRVHLSLTANPSHLEIVDPVVLGKVRAKQDQHGDPPERRVSVMPLLIHGDASFAGQGVVAECFGLSDLKGYRTGGSLHFIVNNQIGFTTYPRYSRSSPYPSDVAKMIEAPIFHVNGDDPEAVLFVTQLALDFRRAFHKDVVIDIVCFRKLGHNEQDEPLVTQPLMYTKIAQHPGTRKLYADRLLAQGVIEAGAPEEMIKHYRDTLDAGKQTVSPVLSNFKSKFAVDWAPFLNSRWTDAADTHVPLDELKRLSERITAVPEGFKLHPTVGRVIEARRQMALGKLPVDWGMAETLAYASLLSNGYDVRLSGQDSARGTFAHRHAVLHDQERERWDEGTYVPLQNVGKDQGDFVVIDSVLSEEAVLGFEYGFSSAEPNALVIWEAQFGDFANGAQVVMDQFISSGETKWGRVCGLVQLLPHGYEGQG